ncbi:MAG TPA: T9SS type A sorting domain-containing protein, partial [Chitinophagales bacterium]|nr:T9SS type A sorting domain-containing protein [Chitinophagales bacterium]
SFNPGAAGVGGPYQVTYSLYACYATKDTFYVLDTPAVTIDTVINVTCNGLANGAINVTVTGGTPGFSYAWTNGSTTEDITGLDTGYYAVTVTDTNACMSSSGMLQITQPDSLTVGLDSLRNASCYGLADGGIFITTTGGTTPYSYAWDNGGTTEDLDGIAAGDYNGTVTDANGCTVNNPAPITITQPDSIGAMLDSMIMVGCNGDSTGGLMVTASGGAGSFTYLWSNGQTTSGLTNVAAGSYDETITDASGCQQTATFAVTEPAVLAASVTSSTDVGCNGQSTGGITVSVSGGTSPYTPNWSNGANTDTLSQLSAGTYTLTVTDANGCSTTLSDGIAEPQPLTDSVTSTNATQGASDGTATATPTGGTAAYHYAWSNGATTQTITGLNAGVYYVTITDAHGCNVTDSAIVHLINGIEDIKGNFSVNLYPNPTKDLIYIDVMLKTSTDLDIEIYNVNGQLINTVDRKQISSTVFTLDFSTEAEGVYFAKIRLGNTNITKRIVVTR